MLLQQRSALHESYILQNYAGLVNITTAPISNSANQTIFNCLFKKDNSGRMVFPPVE